MGSSVPSRGSQQGHAASWRPQRGATVGPQWTVGPRVYRGHGVTRLPGHLATCRCSAAVNIPTLIIPELLSPVLSLVSCPSSSSRVAAGGDTSS